MTLEFHKDGFITSTDPTLLKIDVIYNYLSNESYWAQGRELSIVKKSIENSLCYGVYHDKKQVGFARVVTDCAVFAYILDLFILKEFRGMGLGKWLMECILAHPELQEVKWALSTTDAHGLYEKFGFRKLSDTEKWLKMERQNSTVE